MIYERIDPTAVGCKGQTTTEYRRAAKAKEAAQQEIDRRQGRTEDPARDAVLSMLMQIGNGELKNSNNA